MTKFRSLISTFFDAEQASDDMSFILTAVYFVRLREEKDQTLFLGRTKRAMKYEIASL